MQVELRNGDRYVVMLDTPKGNMLCRVVDDDTWCNLSDYDDNLCYSGIHRLDIVKVFSSELAHQFISHKMADVYLVWERKEDVLITVDGVEYSQSTVKSIIKKYVNG